MEPIIDIHCHIMPGVDDGSPDMATSLEMLRIAARDGITHMILTPHHKPMHHNVSPDHNEQYTGRLQKIAGNAGIAIKKQVAAANPQARRRQSGFMFT